mmetsp:Transcript_23297/g.44446  ORF Transcript_23297/g.44446 Transcript_23297/m.44446 type:complete len:225 (+) Transcript_23297:1488-2162(+)
MDRVCRIVACTATWRRTGEGGCYSTPTIEMWAQTGRWTALLYPRLRPLGTLTGIWALLLDTPVRMTFWICASTAAPPGTPESFISKRRTESFEEWPSPVPLQVGIPLHTGIRDGRRYPIIQRISRQARHLATLMEHFTSTHFMLVAIGLFIAPMQSAMIPRRQEPLLIKSGPGLLVHHRRLQLRVRQHILLPSLPQQHQLWIPKRLHALQVSILSKTTGSANGR